MPPLTPLPHTQVSFRDSFWAPRVETNRRVTLAHVYEQCAATGRLGAWDLKWKPGDANPPHIFWDSDVAKWAEAAAHTLAHAPDPELEGRLDALIDKMARAQRPDGYLNTHFIAVRPEARWTNLRDNHELYCAGHLIEAAVAHHQATGKTTLLDVLRRYADHIEREFGRGPGQKRGYPGHEEIELALVKLYRATGEARYLRLAEYFVDERGRQPHYYDQEARARGEDPAAYYFKTYAHVQAHLPVREQTEVVGHAVRALYLYSGMADVARETGDNGLLQACERLWQHLVSRRLYVTGGAGSTAANEGFSADYDLPDESAYAETCAAIALVFWSQRMLHLTGQGRFADALERALYNGALSGVGLDGRSFFYVNPLASRGQHRREPWFSCACCPPNIARLLASVGGYFYGQDDAGLWVHLYAAGEARFDLSVFAGGGQVPSGRPPRAPGPSATGQPPVADRREPEFSNARFSLGESEGVLRVDTAYPWEGDIDLTLDLPAPAEFTLRLRVPDWCEAWTVQTGEAAAGAPREAVRDGYLHLRRVWRPGERVRLRLEMPARYAYAHPNARQMLGRAALQRGPLVYCLEEADHPGLRLDRVTLPPDPSAWEARHEPGLLGGVTTLRAEGRALLDEGWEERLYRPTPPAQGAVRLTAVPYAVWANRAPGEMRVWLRAET